MIFPQFQTLQHFSKNLIFDGLLDNLKRSRYIRCQYLFSRHLVDHQSQVVEAVNNFPLTLKNNKNNFSKNLISLTTRARWLKLVKQRIQIGGFWTSSLSSSPLHRHLLVNWMQNNHIGEFVVEGFFFLKFVIFFATLTANYGPLLHLITGFNWLPTEIMGWGP